MNRLFDAKLKHRSPSNMNGEVPGPSSLVIQILALPRRTHLLDEHLPTIRNTTNRGKHWWKPLYPEQVDFEHSFDLDRRCSSLDPRLMFNFIDTNKDARLSYLEFRSWMLIIDRTLAEHELLGIFNEIDRNSRYHSLCHSHWSPSPV